MWKSTRSEAFMAPWGSAGNTATVLYSALVQDKVSQKNQRKSSHMTARTQMGEGKKVFRPWSAGLVHREDLQRPPSFLLIRTGYDQQQFAAGAPPWPPVATSRHTTTAPLASAPRPCSPPMTQLASNFDRQGVFVRDAKRRPPFHALQEGVPGYRRAPATDTLRPRSATLRREPMRTQDGPDVPSSSHQSALVRDFPAIPPRPASATPHHDVQTALDGHANGNQQSGIPRLEASEAGSLQNARGSRLPRTQNVDKLSPRTSSGRPLQRCQTTPAPARAVAAVEVGVISEKELESLRTMAAAIPQGLSIHLEHFSPAVKARLSEFDTNSDGLLTGTEIRAFLQATGSGGEDKAHEDTATTGSAKQVSSGKVVAADREVQTFLHPQGAKTPQVADKTVAATVAPNDDENELLVSAVRVVQSFVQDAGVHAETCKLIVDFVKKETKNDSPDPRSVWKTLNGMTAKKFADILNANGSMFVDNVSMLLQQCVQKQSRPDMVSHQEISDENGKFSHLSEATYGTVQDFVAGVNAVGLPHVNPMEGMRLELKEGADSEDMFSAMNSKLNKTTPKREWDFVVKPFKDSSVFRETNSPHYGCRVQDADPLPSWESSLDKTGGPSKPAFAGGPCGKWEMGGRTEMRLQVFLHAASAKGEHGHQFGDYELAAELDFNNPDDKELWLHPAEIGFVKVAVMRFARSQLRRATLGEALHTTSARPQLCHGESFLRPSTAKQVFLCNPKCHVKEKDTMETGLQALASVLKDASCTWGQVVQVSKDNNFLDREQLEAVVRYYHQKLADAQLTEPEVIGLRAYTGPMYLKFNTVLRETSPVFDGTASEHLQGNRYVNSIHCTLSGLTKLSKQCVIPKGRKLYRGISGRRLPQSFLQDKTGTGRGGMEWAFLSCTTNIDVAVGYLGSQTDLAIIFELEVGCIDRGSALSWASQYPEEDEILMGPMCFIEVTNEPYVLNTDKNGSVMVIPAALNSNQGTSIEEIESKRKQELLRTRDNLSKELNRGSFF